MKGVHVYISLFISSLLDRCTGCTLSVCAAGAWVLRTPLAQCKIFLRMGLGSAARRDEYTHFRLHKACAAQVA